MATTRLPAALRRGLRRAAAAATVAALGPDARAQASPDIDPTQFEAAMPDKDATAAWGLRASFGMDMFERRHPTPESPDAAFRGILDLRHEWQLDSAKLWTFTLSDRLEWVADDAGHDNLRNALREGYLTRRFGESWFVDAGRINLRSGVALGYNPTDWLREGAALPQTTQNLQSLRENRLGTVMLRMQTVQDWGAAHLALVPSLAERREPASRYGLDWGRTNEDKAVHARFAPKLSETFSADFLAYGRDGRHPQWGVNMTGVVSNSLLAMLEVSTGSRQGLTAPDGGEPVASHQRIAMGMSWTHSNGTVFTLERHMSTDALDARGWDAWRFSDDPATQRRLAQMRAQRNVLGEPLTRDAWYMRVSATGIGPRADLDLNAFVRLNPHDHSYVWQVDAGWHVFASTSIFASLGGFQGSARSEFGANPTQTTFSVRIERAL